MATLVPCLAVLRAECNRLWPGRDTASDGWIGDPAHQSRNSDHNPDERGLVHAIDVDRDLRGDVTMQQLVDHIVARCRSGIERRLTYVIFDGRIWTASSGWNGRAYTGANPHDKHAHFSASDAPARERDTTDWQLEDLVALTEEQTRMIVREEIARGWSHPLSTGGGSRDGMLTTIGNRTGATTNQQLPAVLAALQQADVDENAIVAGVLAVLSPAAIVAAIPPGIAQQVADELAKRLAG